MPRKTKKEKEAQKKAELKKLEEYKKKKKVRDEITAVIIIAVGLFLVISMFTGTTGAVGAAVKAFFAGLLGWAAYILPFFLLVYGVLVFAQKTSLVTAGSLAAVIILFVLLTCFVANLKAPLKDFIKYDFSYSIKEIYNMGTDGGGIIGVYVGGFIRNLIGEMGLYLVCAAGVVIAILLILNTPLSTLFDNLKIKRKAHKAAKEAALAEREEMEALAVERENEARKLREQQALKEAREAEEAKAQRIAKQAQLAEENNRQQRVDTDKLPKLDMTAMEDFHGTSAETRSSKEDFIEKYEEISPAEEKPAVPRFKPEDIGLKTPEKTPIKFEGENITENQQKVLETWVGEDLTGRSTAKTDSVPAVPQTETVEKTAVQPVPKQTAAAKTAKTDNASHTSAPAASDKNASEANKGTQLSAPVSSYVFPPVDLLSKPVSSSGGGMGQNLAEQAKLLEDTLSSFGVSAKVVDVVKGPAVTRFEVQPATGVKVSKIAALHDDLALNLRAKSLRIEAPIPGKAAVGIEVSNDSISMITLREIIESKEFKESKSKITVSLGRSIDGKAIVTDLKSMPHLLVAGSTGSGKSVCINSMLISLLYKSTPEEVQLILIDPKVVELSIYNGIPHLMVPVVTDAAKASAALGWAVSEMDNRYKKFADEGVRDLKSYNETVVANEENDKVLPQIVIVIDELAELIMMAKSTVEDSICRLAQKARAAGMHLIVATQRPSTDVITGLIKANIPSRIAFAVSSLTDSRVILDVGGAEHLLGKGDMLYAPQSFSKPLRVQGCFVSDNEVRDVIEFIKKQGEIANYNEDILHAMSNAGINNAGSAEESSEEDELLKDAIETVVRAEQCSVSMLQRRFRIGYNRAARLVDLMEERGIVGPPEGGARARKVNMTLSEFQALEEQAAAADNESDTD